jgi:hypothetical protein
MIASLKKMYQKRKIHVLIREQHEEQSLPFLLAYEMKDNTTAVVFITFVHFSRGFTWIAGSWRIYREIKPSIHSLRHIWTSHSRLVQEAPSIFPLRTTLVATELRMSQMARLKEGVGPTVFSINKSSDEGTSDSKPDKKKRKVHFCGEVPITRLLDAPCTSLTARSSARWSRM